MVNPIHVLHCFPSGLTVAAARNEAKQQLDAGNHDTLIAALNHIAMRELGFNWSDAMDKLSSLHANPNTLVHDTLSEQVDADCTEGNAEATKNEKAEQRDVLFGLSATVAASETFVERIQHKITMKLSLTDISTLLSKYANIGYEGVLLTSITSAEAQAQRDQLMVAVNECNIAHYFLSKCDTNKTLNRKLDSAELARLATIYAQRKHLIADDQRINEGALILAAYHLGLTVHLPKAGQAAERAFAQAHFNISSRSALLKSLD